jgi:hypothetical protein
MLTNFGISCVGPTTGVGIHARCLFVFFVSYVLLQNIKRSRQRRENQGSLLHHTRLESMDTSVGVNEG